MHFSTCFLIHHLTRRTKLKSHMMSALTMPSTINHNALASQIEQRIEVVNLQNC